MKARLLLLLLSMIPGLNSLYAQQDAAYSQYMFNGLVINPGYAGSKPFLSSALLYRKQWVDFEGAPVTQSFYLHGPTPNRKVGLGLTFVHDKIGVTDQTDVYGSYAYHFRFSKGFLSMGLQGGLSYYSSKLSDLKIWDTDDEIFAYNTKTSLLPNFGFGLYYYATRFYAGISVPHLLNNNPNNAYLTKASHQERYYNLTSGYVIEVNRDIKVKPSVLVKYTEGAPVQADFNVNFLLQNTFWVGGSYRTGDAFVGIFEFQVTRKLRIGYAYDYTLSSIRYHSAGSHEVMLGYDFGYDVLKMKTPRYF